MSAPQMRFICASEGSFSYLGLFLTIYVLRQKKFTGIEMVILGLSIVLVDFGK